MCLGWLLRSWPGEKMPSLGTAFFIGLLLSHLGKMAGRSDRLGRYTARI